MSSNTKSSSNIIGININGSIYKVNKSIITSPILGDKEHFFRIIFNHEEMVEKDNDGNYIIEDQDGIRYLLDFMMSSDKESFITNLCKNDTSSLLLLQSAANFACMTELASYIQKRINLLENKFYLYGSNPQPSVTIMSTKRANILSTKVFKTINSPFVKYNNNIDFLIVKGEATSGTITLYLSINGTCDPVDGLYTLPFKLAPNTYSLMNIKFETTTGALICTYSLPCGKVLNSSKIQYYGLTNDAQLGIKVNIDDHGPGLTIRQYL